MQLMAKTRPLRSLGTGEVDVGIATGLRRTEAFSFEGPLPFRSLESSRSTCNFVCTFKRGRFPSVHRCDRGGGFMDQSRSVLKCIHDIGCDGSLPFNCVKGKGAHPS